MIFDSEVPEVQDPRKWAVSSLGSRQYEQVAFSGYYKVTLQSLRDQIIK